MNSGATRGVRANESAADKAARQAATRAANLAKKDAKRNKRRTPSSAKLRTSSLHPRTNATGSISLIDAAGLKYFIDTNITFSTTSSASGSASEASYTQAIVASTSAGGSTTSSLNDMFDGYNTLCVSLTNATGPCQTGNPSYTFFNQTGAPAGFDATVPATPACTNRQVAFPAKTIGGLSVTRKVFVPTNDRFIRWANFFTNTTGAPITFTMITGNNLGSDANTIIVSSSSGDNIATVADTWVSTFQNFSGNTSSDPRIGHVLQGTGAATPVSNISFANGDDNPYWTYSITLAAGQTKAIVNFATGMGTKAAANTQAAALALLPSSSTQCLSNVEYNQIVNFATDTDLSIVKTSTPAGTVNGGQAFTYTLAVTNGGPDVATAVSVTDPLPAGVTFVSATGTGWTCNQVAGTVTCTLPTLPVGAANPITISAVAPPSAAVLSNTATVSSSTTESNPANNTSTNTLTVVANSDLSITKTASGTTAYGANAFTYTLAVSNLGPNSASNVSVSDTLPAGSSFVSASGTGWACSQVAGVVTCTRPLLAVGAAPSISLVINAPATAVSTTLVNTATVTSSATDSAPANNASTSTVTLLPAGAIPTLSGWMLILLATSLGIAGLFLRRS
jgi:uncharacterized repeat protein (TIGR01451 family)